MIIYFAHPINTYKNEIDEQCTNIIKKYLGSNIINPSDDIIQQTFKEYRVNNPDSYMNFFGEIVSKCDSVVYLPFRDGKIGAGIWFEVKTIYDKEGHIYEIDLNKQNLQLVDFEHVSNNKLSIDETRMRIKNKY